MSGVRVLVGTRKGAFILTADGKRSLKQILDSNPDRGLKQIDELIAKSGDNPQLLLTKASVLHKAEIAITVPADSAKDTTKKPDKPVEWKSTILLKDITKRWPDFAPAFYDLAIEFYSNDSKEKSIEPLKRYVQLAPWDNRPLQSLAEIYEGLKKLPEAEALRKQLLERDSDKMSRIGELIAFYLRQDQSDNASSKFHDSLMMTSNADEAFEALDANIDDDEDLDKELLTRYEKLLVSFPKELGTSKSGLKNLARVQDELEEHEAALKTMQRVIQLKPDSSDYLSLAKLQRVLGHFTEGVAATNEALKLDEKNADALFERACNQAQLGQKKEAMESLKKAIEIDSDLLDSITDDALKPLDTLPEFKTMKDKLQKESEEGDAPAEDARHREDVDPRDVIADDQVAPVVGRLIEAADLPLRRQHQVEDRIVSADPALGERREHEHDARAALLGRHEQLHQADEEDEASP